MDLQEQVVRLQQETRRMKRWNLAMIAVAGAGLLMGAQAQMGPTIEAEAIRLRDADGNMRALLSMSTANEPILNLYDAKGAERMSLGLTDKGGFLAFNGGDKKPRVLLSEAGPALYFIDAKGNRPISLFTGQSGTGLNIDDENGKRRASLGIAGGGAVLTLRDAEGKVVLSAP